MSANGEWGVLISNEAMNNTVSGNYIGTDVSGTLDLGNEDGVGIFTGANHNLIGGNTPSRRNLIGYSEEVGVEVIGNTSLYNTLQQNSIHSNAEKGIALTEGGNNSLAAPVITDVDESSGSVSGMACAECTVEIFSDTENEGRVYEGSVTAFGGTWTFNKGSALTGPRTTATATDAQGNTSEFSSPFPASRLYLPILFKNFDPMAPLPGTIEVVTNRSDASWSIEGPSVVYKGVGVGSRTITDAPAGNYTIEWGGLPYCTTPPPEAKTLSAAGAITFEGNYTCDDGPWPGYWEGQSNFTGSFRVSADRTRITNLEGSFWTPTCGTIDFPDDITPSASIDISNNEISVYMDDPGTITFLSITGAFNTRTSVEGDYLWGVEGCGFGLTRLSWNARWQSD